MVDFLGGHELMVTVGYGGVGPWSLMILFPGQ